MHIKINWHPRIDRYFLDYKTIAMMLLQDTDHENISQSGKILT